MSEEEHRFWGEAGPNCVRDPRLTLAAREYAAALAASSHKHSDGDLDRFRFVLAKAGVADYPIRPLLGRLNGEGRSSLLSMISERRQRWSHCGVGAAGEASNGWAVWIDVDRIVALDPIPTTLTAGSRVWLSGRVTGRSQQPVQPFIGLPDSSVIRLKPAPTNSNGRFRVSLFFEVPGRHELELLVDVGRGPETAILVPIFVGVPPDPRPVVAPDSHPEDSGRPSDEALFSYLTAARERLGLAPLERDARLDSVAEAHSREMASRGFFGHVSPSRGTLVNRLAEHGFTPHQFAENVARSRSSLRIHRNLMASPSHRINALNPTFTHVGIGVARDGEDLIATQIFAKW